MSEPAIQVNFHRRQTLAWQALQRPDVQDCCYGGAKGGGKSFFLCWWAFLLALQIARTFDLQPSRWAPSVGWLGRKQSVDFVSTTLKTWKSEIPHPLYKLRGGSDQSPRAIVILDRVAIDYGGLDSQASINKFNSAEYAFIGVDQAEETTADDVSVLRASRRLSLPMSDPTTGQVVKRPALEPFKGLFTANPANCWLKHDFIEDPHPTHQFVQALPADNPFLPEGYIEELRRDFKHRPELLAAYLEGSWDAFEDPQQIIREAWIRAAMDRTLHYGEDQRHYLSCDVARFGDDETVINRFIETRRVEKKVFGKKSTTDVAAILHKMARDHTCTAVVVDEDGVGGGVVDQLHTLNTGGYLVIPVQSASKADDPDRYVNRRAEMWDTTARMLEHGEVDIVEMEQTERSQLCTPLYEFRSGRMLVEGKDKIKERLGRSPDHGDSYVLGLANLSRVPARRSWDNDICERRRRGRAAGGAGAMAV